MVTTSPVRPRILGPIYNQYVFLHLKSSMQLQLLASCFFPGIFPLQTVALVLSMPGNLASYIFPPGHLAS